MDAGATRPTTDSNIYTAEPTSTTQPQCTSCSHTGCVYTVFIKVLSPKNKRDYHQHTLWDISPRMITTPKALKEVVSLQLGETKRLLQRAPNNLGLKSERSSRCLAVTCAKQESYLVMLRSWWKEKASRTGEWLGWKFGLIRCWTLQERWYEEKE